MLNKKYIIHVFTLILLIVSGCSQTQQQGSTRASKVQKPMIDSSPAKPARKEKLHTQNKKTEKRYYVFNKQKFSATEPVIKAGVKVFDMQLNTYAHVTNKVVAVLKDSSQFREKLVLQELVTNSNFVTNGNVDFRFVTNGVVEIIFKHKQTNMLEMYKTVAEMKNVTQAELLLQYQSRITAQEY